MSTDIIAVLEAELAEAKRMFAGLWCKSANQLLQIDDLEAQVEDLRAACEQKQEIIDANETLAGDLLRAEQEVETLWEVLTDGSSFDGNFIEGLRHTADIIDELPEHKKSVLRLWLRDKANKIEQALAQSEKEEGDD